MFRTAGLFIVALTFRQALAGVVKPEVFTEDVINEVLTTNDRTASGWEAYNGQFPYMAALRVMHPMGTVIRCGSAVVHRNWVLTTGRCLSGPPDDAHFAVVRAGVTDLTAVPEYISETTEWWTHPRFDAYDVYPTQPNNIGILKLSRPLTYSKLVQPIRIQLSADANANYDSQVFMASAWNRILGTSTSPNPNAMNWVYLRGVTNAVCRQSLVITDAHICATAFNATSQSICNAESGSSLVQTSPEGEPVLVGLAISWSGAGCRIDNRPSGFMRPGPFHSWLTEVTGLDFENLNEEDEVTATPEPSTTEVAKPPTTEAAVPPTTVAPKPDSEENDEVSNSDSSESKEDPEISQLLNKLHVKVLKVSKVKVNNNIKIN